MHIYQHSESRKSYYKTVDTNFLDVKHKPIPNKDRGITRNTQSAQSGRLSHDDKFSSIDHFLDGVFDDFNFDEFILPVLKKDKKDFIQFVQELENKN